MLFVPKYTWRLLVMRTVLYARVSTEKQSVDNQLKILQEYCKRNGLKVVQVYKDYVSGSKDSRPEFDEMLHDMRNHRFDCIAVYKLDRIGRSLKHLLQLFEEFEKNKIKFVSVTQNIDTNTPEGKMMVRMLMVLAEYERELTVARINDTLGRYKEHLRKDGKFVARDGKIRHGLGRPVGSHDSKPRRKSGYYLRWSKQSTPRKKEGILSEDNQGK